MKFSGWRGLAGLLITAAIFLGCTVPPSSAQPPLTAAAAQAALDGWNPSYCKVAEFYGLYKPEAAGAVQVAYALIVNPSDKAQKPTVYEAKFHLLTRPDGQRGWFLTSLITHSSGLTRRQGWDNLMIPLKEVSSKQGAVSSKK